MIDLLDFLLIYIIISVPNGTLCKEKLMYSLDNLFLFDGLEEPQIKKIILSFDAPVCFEKGAEIYSKTSFRKAMGIIVSGKAEALDDTLLKKSFVQGDVFGVATLFNSERDYVSKIVAKSECQIQFIDEEALKRIFEEYPCTAANYIAFLSGRIRFLNEKIRLFTCKSASAKLYEYLSENADENNEIEISNMSRLAKMTSIGRTSLYRAVDELVDSKMIERFGNKFKVR